MTDCSNVEVRDLLPDLVSGMLAPADVKMVEAHLLDCTDCAEEVELLRVVYALRPSAKPIDVPSVVASLPKPPYKVRSISPRRVSHVQLWRMAAALATVTLGGLSWQMIKSGGLGFGGDAAGRDSAVITTVLDSSMQIDNGKLLAAGGADELVTVSFGGLGNYSDEELQLILDQLDRWDGVPSTEPLPSSASPIIPGAVGDQK